MDDGAAVHVSTPVVTVARLWWESPLIGGSETSIADNLSRVTIGFV